MTRRTKDLVLALLEQGLGPKEIADELRLTVGAVRHHMPKEPAKRATPDIKERAVKLYAEGYTTAEIGKMVGFSGPSVGSWLKHQGIELRAAGPRGHDDATRGKVLALYESGKSINWISNDLNVNQKTIRDWLDRGNVGLRPRGSEVRAEAIVDEETVEVWAALHAEGTSVTSIAGRYDTTKRTVSKLLRFYGHPVRRPGAPSKVETPSRKELFDKYQANPSMDCIAGDYGVTRWTVQRWMKALEIETRGPGHEARTAQDLFDENTPRRPKGQCWPWAGSQSPAGYGVARLRENGSTLGMGAHKLAYLLYKGDVPTGLVVRHMCHKRACCNPDHLEIGTHQDNANDRVRSGRRFKHRDPKARRDQHRDNQSRLMSRVQKDPDNGCWIWIGGRQRTGYGVMVWNERRPGDPKNMRVHRASHILFKGDIPKGRMIRHLCHNKLCVNPDHLALGSAKDNTRDEAAAGKLTVGEAHHQTRLTRGQVIQLRQLRFEGRSIRELSVQFGISSSSVSAITLGRTWRHVGGPVRVAPGNKGVGNPSARLRPADVRDIRQLYSTGKATQNELAERYNVTAGTVAHIVHHRTWKHIN